MAKVLVAGGAGYVGSATVAWLLDRGHQVHILDDLSTGHRELALAPLTVARVGERGVVLPLLKQEKFDCVMHFAARSLVGESFSKRVEYFENNVDQTRALLEMMLEAGISRFVFSSTCAIFGSPKTLTLREDHPKNPESPYGETKLAAEGVLEEFARTRGLQAIALRYFNASGAEDRLRVGEWHEPETHLIPSILRAQALGVPAQIFGTAYSTRDGTCVRDYIHVTDLAEGHEAAMLRLITKNPGGLFEAYNLGTESGYSVREVLAECEKAIGKQLAVVEKPARPGDPSQLVADSTLAKRELGFHPRRGLAQIIGSAVKWEQRRRSRFLKKAVFLDRDGTLNEDPGYISDPGQLKLIPNVGKALKRLHDAGYLLVVVSNQSGVARGLIKPEQLPRVHARLDELLANEEGKIDHYEICIHRPEDLCDCRKPKPELLFRAASRLGLDLSRSFMVGDKMSDLQAGKNARCRATLLVRTGEGRGVEAHFQNEPDFIGDSLVEVADWILNQET